MFRQDASRRPTADRFRSSPNYGHHTSEPPLPKSATTDNWQRQMGDTHFVALNEQAGAGPFLHATSCDVAAVAL